MPMQHARLSLLESPDAERVGSDRPDDGASFMFRTGALQSMPWPVFGSDGSARRRHRACLPIRADFRASTQRRSPISSSGRKGEISLLLGRAQMKS